MAPNQAKQVTLKELMALNIWRYLGADMQEMLVDRYAALNEERKSAVASALLALEESYKEITDKTNQATFVYLMQEVLMDLAADLEDDLRTARRDVAKMAESSDYDDEMAEIENQLAEFGL